MKRAFAWCLLFGAYALPGAARAFTPAQGNWYNPSESGRGINIEVQNNVMAVTSYVYDAHGTPIWYTSAGIYNEGASTFTGTFDSGTGGQCFGCAYVSPLRTIGAGGAMSIVFSSAETGTLYFPGGSTPIQHFNFGYAGKQGYLQGEWAFSLGGAGAISSQWIVFNGTYTGSDGTVYVSGTGDGNSSMVALGAYLPSSDTFAIAVGDGVGYTFTYVLNGDNARMAGVGWIEPTGTTISGAGSVSIGSRILTPAEVSGGFTPSAAMRTATATSDITARFQALESMLQRQQSR